MNAQAAAVNVEKVIREYLPYVLHLSLATERDNAPWVCEVHFAYDDDLNLYFRSLASRRHSMEISENPKVAGNIIKQHSLDESAVGVYFEGIARLLEADEELKIAYKCIKERLHAEDNILEEAKKKDGHKFYKITVKNWYVFGRFGLPHGQKHKLEWKYEK